MLLHTTFAGIVSSVYSVSQNQGGGGGEGAGEEAGEGETSNIFNISTRDTEENILISSPSNPSNSVNIAFGTDTYDLYIWNGSSWSKYLNDA
ncbi:MAG: hypothetical protein CL833_02815 [Crocinitomicaceae bacterium]|nr:hypothetical protein [Crocinitomicaceae bacterium]|tara:strand:+ start:1976 stop:2251 length:276 start_codon:yes stop_codon:yes gene_type:complete